MPLFTGRILSQMLIGRMSSLEGVGKTYVLKYRCLPFSIIDLFHLNNGSLLRYGDLVRWRMFSQCGILNYMISNSIGYLIVEQNIQYRKPMNPFMKFVVETDAYTTNDKWIHVRHRFLEYQDNSSSLPAKELAVINLKSVFKSKEGKTIAVSNIRNINSWTDKFLSNEIEI